MTEEKKNKNSDHLSAEGRFFRDIDVEFLIHELKDPVAVIETAVRMLLEKPDKYGPLTGRQQKTLERALRNSKKARGLLADLLEVGRSDAGCFQCCHFNALDEVNAVLMETLESVDADLQENLGGAASASEREALLVGGGIRIGCSDGARQVRLCQDQTKFRQIVGNLIKNALQHRRRRLDIGMDCVEDRLLVEVVDDGPGVEKENRELIFMRYTRMKPCATLSRTGHGLGLAGARILARRMGGDITVKCDRGPGAVFRFTLPLVFEQPEGLSEQGI
ncbi:HAMP domain-containing sensor histidine kinase [uncultured Desulfosarcina sp.]|uniref:sensor histidine kinase n=1 Tax=uncultured Desulfosarcina sp. TaxID=218289 RepID=UPI0029C6E743|nr:HAMP domain-containing sensor histidine kinase [uncultured Desulfosarcina sp.]